ncbi:MAG: transporter substrate-binding protein [Pirellulales bacterium]
MTGAGQSPEDGAGPLRSRPISAGAPTRDGESDPAGNSAEHDKLPRTEVNLDETVTEPLLPASHSANDPGVDLPTSDSSGESAGLPGVARPESSLSSAVGGEVLGARSAARSAAAGVPPGEWVGQTLGRYRILGKLGQGGMGVVLKGFDTLIEREVAIKVLSEQVATNPTALGRFLGEARAAGKLIHPQVTAIYEIGQEGSVYYLVMEYLSGGSTANELRPGRGVGVLQATRYLIDACDGLAAAHAAGIIHRDIKPANLLRTADHRIKITDFGLAKGIDTGSRGLTQAGVVVGTPYFMSPEQCQSLPLDFRTDIYSLGATYFCLLTGREPYHDSDSVVQVMYAHCRAEIPDPRSLRPELPAACAAIVRRAMAKLPEDRYPDVATMRADLAAVATALEAGVEPVLPYEAETTATAPADSSSMTSSPAGGPPLVWDRRKLLATGLGLAAAGLASAGWWQTIRHRRQKLRGQQASAGSSGVVPAAEASVKIGVLHSLTGTMSQSEMPVIDAVLFAVGELNAAGGVLGRQIKTEVRDGASRDDTFAEMARELIVKEEVAALFGCWTSSSRKSVKTIVEEFKHVLFYPVQYEGLEQSPNIVYLGAAPNQQMLPAMEWAQRELGKRRFFLVGSDYVFPRAAREIISDSLQGTDAALVGSYFVPTGTAQLQPLIDAIQAARPDMIVNALNGDINLPFFRALRQAGVKSEQCPTLSLSISEEGLRNLGLERVDGDYAAWTYFQSIDTPENRDFVARFQAKYPLRNVTDPMEAAYVGVRLWAAAVEAAGSFEPDKMRRSLLNLRMVAPSGSTRVDPDTQHLYKTPRIGQMRGTKQFQIVWTAPAPLEPEPFPRSRTVAEWNAFLTDLRRGWGDRWTAPPVP